MKNIIAFIFILTATLALNGCGNLQVDEGERLSQDKVAIIKNQDGLKQSIYLSSVDGKSTILGQGLLEHLAHEMTGGKIYEVLPGQHVLDISVSMPIEAVIENHRRGYPTSCEKEFELHAGHVYQISGFWNTKTYRISLIDETTEREIKCIKSP